MPIIGGNLVNSDLGLPFTEDHELSLDANDLALETSDGVGTLTVSFGLGAAGLALTSSGLAALGVNGDPATLQGTGDFVSMGVAELLVEKRMAAAATALDSSASTAVLEPQRNLSAFAAALTSTAVADLTAEQFTPDMVSNLELWLDASVGVTTNMSDEVTEWADQSGNGRNFTSSSGSRPSYNSSDSNLNSQPSLSFDAETSFGDGDGLDLSTEAIIGDGTQNCAFFAVVYFATHPASTVIPFVYYEYNAADASDLDAQNWILFGDENVAGTELIVTKGGNGTDNDSGTSRAYGSANIFHFFAGPNQVTDLHAFERLIVGSNGQGGGTNTTASIDSTPTNPTSGSHIGRRADDSFGRRWNGEIAEVIIYKKSLTEEEVNNVNAYLSSKYGIPINQF